MRLMPAPLMVADTGNIVFLTQKSKAAAHEAHPCSRACQIPLPAMPDEDHHRDLAAREATGARFAIPDEPSTSRNRPQAINRNGQ